MGHVVKRLPWCDIDIDTTKGHIFLQEKWKYTWQVKAGLTAWTLAEKRDFHNHADRYVWAAWSNRVTLDVSGTSDFAIRFTAGGVSINLDIRWVTADEHWWVVVTKIAPADTATSGMNWNARTINLDSNDLNSRIRQRGTPPVNYSQTPVVHEFGHAAGNTSVLGRGDEYKASSPHQNDRASLMNVGHELRNRHFQTIIDELNTMIPGTTFTVKNIL